MFKKIKSRYHIFMYKWWNEEAACLSRILGEQRFESHAWRRANRKFMYHFLRIEP